MFIKATRECVFNGDDDQKIRTFEYQEGEMLSTFLRQKIAVPRWKYVAETRR